MNISKCRTVALSLALLLLAGCGASMALPHGPLPSVHIDRQRHSWMGGGVANQDLLYVANGNGEVVVYRYWLHSIVGVLTSLTQPMGECVDAKSDVYITDSGTQEIIEFAHGGTKPIKKLNDAPDTPVACSVDQISGDLAVANKDGGTQSNIAIWSKGSGQPKHYNDSLFSNFIALAYDAKGNLLTTNGGSYNSPAVFAWLPRGRTQLVNINVPGPNPSSPWTYVYGIQWDGKYFVIDNYYLNRVALIHGEAYYVGTTNIYGGSFPIWIYDNKPGQQGAQAVGGSYSHSYSNVSYWHYPAGGNPYYKLSHGVDQPLGITVSLRTQ